MKRIVYQDTQYSIVAQDICTGVDISVYTTYDINSFGNRRCNDFNHYTVVPPNKLQKMMFGSYESQIKSAVDALINDIEIKHNSDDIQREKSTAIYECTNKTLTRLYGE